MSESILKLKDIVKTFPGAKVLDNICLAIRPGEVMGLVGENGAGKSTLVKIITGIYTKDAGEIFYKDKKVEYSNAKEANEAGISIIHQEFSIFPNMTVAENIFLDKKEYIGRLGKVNKKKMKEDAVKAIQQVGASIDVTRLGGTLNVHEQQVVEIAKAVSSKSEVLIMDEPTAALPENEVKHLFDMIRLLKNQGVSIIYVSHRMKEIQEICDRVCVLRNGENVGILDMHQASIEDIVTLMIGRDLKDYYPRTEQKTLETLFEVKGLSGKGFHDASFDVKKGEILGIYGLAGSGAKELVEGIVGLNKLEKGQIFIGDKPVKIKSFKKAIQYGIGYVPSDRRRQGIIKEMSVEDNIILVIADFMSKLSFISKTKAKEISTKSMDSLHIKATGLGQAVNGLSGGNQQKVVLGKWLSINPKLLILNEPTRGVDVGAKAEIYALINDLVAQEIGIIMISSEVPEVLGMANRILVMNKGEIKAEFTYGTTHEEELLRVASGGGKKDTSIL